MKTTAPKELGILVIAAVFGVIAGGVALVAFAFALAWSVMIAGVVAVVTAIALWLGWREPAVRPMGQGVGPVNRTAASDGGRQRPDAQTDRTRTTEEAAAAQRERADRASGAHGAGTGTGPAAGAAAAGSTGGMATTDMAATDGRDAAGTDASSDRSGSAPVTGSDAGSSDSRTDGPDGDRHGFISDRPEALTEDGDRSIEGGIDRDDSPVDLSSSDANPGSPDADVSTSERTDGFISDQPEALSGQADLSGEASEGAAKTDDGGSVVKPSARLPGQEDLAGRKGSWKYEASPKASSEPASKPASESDTAGNSTHFDGAGAAAATAGAEAEQPSEKPQMMEQARDGGPDNLKEIRGIGPKLETMLHEMGVFHFDQIAGWSDRELAWVDSHLEGFKGRASRDEWVSQAKILAEGGETEFSQKVDRGDVY